MTGPVPMFALVAFLLAVGVGGATAMDVTLPLIEQCAGPGIVPVSFASGLSSPSRCPSSSRSSSGSASDRL